MVTTRSDGSGMASAMTGSSRDAMKSMNDQLRRTSMYSSTFRGVQNPRYAQPTGSPMEVFGSSEHSMCSGSGKSGYFSMCVVRGACVGWGG
jgi:hypothetical protein